MSNIGILELISLGFVCCSAALLILGLASAIRVVPEGQKLAIFRLGKYAGQVGPGLVFVLPFIDKTLRVDSQDQMAEAGDPERLWGVHGESLTQVHEDGQVKVNDKVWDARSADPIPPGARVRVRRVVLEIEED